MTAARSPTAPRIRVGRSSTGLRSTIAKVTARHAAAATSSGSRARQSGLQSTPQGLGGVLRRRVMKRVLITGGSGFIGRKLVGELLARGDQVTVLTREVAQARK